MNPPLAIQQNTISQKDFWGSLQEEMLTAHQKPTQDDLTAFVEQSFMFSMFFRGCSHMELVSFKSFLNIQDNGYLLILDMAPIDRSTYLDFEIDPLLLYRTLKKTLSGSNSSIGPLISNRMCILISDSSLRPDEASKKDSIQLANNIVTTLYQEFQITTSVGVGNVHSIHSIFNSFIESLTCLYYSSPNQVVHIRDVKEKEEDRFFEYMETEKHMFEAIRLRRTEAYDYFGIIMDWVRNLSDDAKRNKILEILVNALEASRIDREKEKFFNYTGHLKELLELEGDQLIEWAYQKFMYITGYVRPQNTIDYSNRIVQATKEYLENHYTEDISLEDVAEQVNISPQYFSKLIKKTTGFNFIDWLSMLRVKKAKELLSSSNMTVKEVCFLVGYKDPNYFSRIFKKRIGLTPSEFVKNKTFNNMS